MEVSLSNNLNKSLKHIVDCQDTDNLKTAYIRGRKLHGKTVQLPAGYYGSVVEKGETKREQPEPSDAMDEVEELADPIEIAPLNSKADFDDLVIWGHESTADSATDPYLRSMEEWVSFSEKVGLLYIHIFCETVLNYETASLLL